MKRRSVIDAAEMRRLNRLTVLRAIRDHRLISRIDIARQTGLNKATVSSLIDQLIEESFVQEVGLGDSKGGRKPVMLSIRPDAAFSIGIDFQINSMHVVLANLHQEVQFERTIQVDPAALRSPELLIAQIVQQAKRMLNDAPCSPHGVIGIGLSVPGLANFYTGVVQYLPNLGLHEIPLGEILTRALGIPVYVDNDANCGAWALYRKNPEIHNFVYINVAVGIGAGIVIDGQLYRGESGFAGEVGHMTVVPDGLRCRCGNYGCWEQYASISALHREYTDSMGGTSPIPLTQDFVQKLKKRIEQGDFKARDALSKVSGYLGIGIGTIVNVINPQLILLDGGITDVGSLVIEKIRELLSYRALPGTREVQIQTAVPYVRAAGAAGIVIEETLFRLVSRASELQQSAER